MNDYHGAWMTNYINWKPGCLNAITYLWDVGLDIAPDGRARLYDQTGNGSPLSWVDPDDDDNIPHLKTLGIPDEVWGDDIDLMDFIRNAIPEGENLVIMEAGTEGLTHCFGQAMHVTSKGVQTILSLEDIYETIKEA